MLEFLTGAGLATAAGLNAYIPLLVLGLSSRFLDFVELPAAWAWLENEWVLLIIGVLLVVEIVADKIPVVDSINDWIQTIIRPTAGGIVFGAGSGTQTAVVTDPAAFFQSDQWVPIAIGVVLSLLVHSGKTLVRPAANAASFGLAAPALSAAEDGASVTMALFAILFPILVLLGMAGLVAAVIWLVRRSRRRRRERAAA